MAVSDEFVQIRALEGVAAGDHEQGGGLPEGGHLVQQVLGSGGVQFARITVGDGLGAAVQAGQRAGPGGLPDDDEGPLARVVPLAADGVGGVCHRTALPNTLRLCPAALESGQTRRAAGR